MQTETRQVLVPLADGVEELEAVTVIDLLRRAEVEVTTAAVGANRTVTARRGVVMVADACFAEVAGRDFDMIVLPGGLPGATHLDREPGMYPLLQRMHERGKYTAAICAAPKVLAGAGLLAGRRATCYPGVLQAMDLPDTTIEDAPVVADDTVITSRGPGTAMDFALHLVELLRGRERRQALETALQRP